MKFYSFEIGNWDASTKYLNVVEKGVYLELLNAYYTTEKPLSDLFCKRVAIAMQMDLQMDLVCTVFAILEQFFYKTEEGWRHKKCDEVIAKYHDISEKRSESAKKRGKKQTVVMQAQCESKAIAEQLQSNSKPIEPLSINHNLEDIYKEKNIKKRSHRSSDIAKPDDVSEQVWNDFVTLRKTKKAPITETAINGFRKDAEKNGVSLEEVIAFAVKNGYQGSYYKKEQGATSAIPKAPDITNHVFDPEEIRRLGFDTV